VSVGNRHRQRRSDPKFTNNGKCFWQIGHEGKSQGSSDIENLNRPTQVVVYQKNQRGVRGGWVPNRRVIVFDADTGKFKAYVGSVWEPPDDSAPRHAFL